MKNYYTILGVQSSASMGEIKRAYRGLAVRYHPDKNPDPRAQALFQEINEAYDVLGDQEKRRTYDLRLANPFAEILDAAPASPAHRDPAYRRKRPHPGVKREPTSRDLMKQYLPYFRWTKIVGLAFTLLLAIDLALPHQSYRDQVAHIYEVRGRRGAYVHDVLETTGGRSFIVYNREAEYFQREEPINIVITPIFSTEMRITGDAGHTAELGYIYGGVLRLFPIILFAVSLLGIVLRDRPEFAFNASIVCGVLNVILLYLMFRL